MTSAFSWQNSVSLCPASCYPPRPNLPVTPSISWLPTFAFQSPTMKMTPFLSISSWMSCYVFIELFNFSFFGISSWDIDLNYSDTEWFALEMNWDYSAIFEIASKCCISDSFLDYEGYSISSKGFLPTVVNAHLNYVHPFWSILIHWFLRCRCSLLPSPSWSHPMYLDSWT